MAINTLGLTVRSKPTAIFIYSVLLILFVMFGLISTKNVCAISFVTGSYSAGDYNDSNYNQGSNDISNNSDNLDNNTNNSDVSTAIATDPIINTSTIPNIDENKTDDKKLLIDKTPTIVNLIISIGSITVALVIVILLLVKKHRKKY